MVMDILCLSLIMMGALKIQAQDAVPTFILNPPLRKFPLQPDFQYDQFQGKWYAVGWAQNIAKNESLGKTALHSTVYKLNDDHSYNVTSEWLSNQQCVHKFRMIFPTDQSGLFNLEKVPRYDGLHNFTLRVLETDYNQFAMVVLKIIIYNTVYFEHTLYGRTKELSPELKKRYRNVARSLGLPDNYIIFNDPRVECTNSGRAVWQ